MLFRSNIELYFELSKLDKKTGRSRLVNVDDEFVGKYKSLKFGNGGSWCRKSAMQANKIKRITVKCNGHIDYSWDATEEEKKIIEEKGGEIGIISDGQKGCEFWFKLPKKIK